MKVPRHSGVQGAGRGIIRNLGRAGKLVGDIQGIKVCFTCRNADFGPVSSVSFQKERSQLDVNLFLLLPTVYHQRHARSRSFLREQLAVDKPLVRTVMQESPGRNSTCIQTQADGCHAVIRHDRILSSPFACTKQRQDKDRYTPTAVRLA